MTLIQFRHANAIDVGVKDDLCVVVTDEFAVLETAISESPAVIVVGQNAGTDEVNAIRKVVLGKRACFVLVRAGDTSASIVRLVRYGFRRLG